jgi:glycosyltransferase involved in cell wall biosynthesis
MNQLLEIDNSTEIYFITSHKKDISNKINRNIKEIPVDEYSFGLNTIKKAFQLSISTPKYYRGLSNILDEINPDIVVCNDSSRLYFWQLLFKKMKSGPSYNIYLYTELKNFSKNIFINLLIYINLKFLSIFSKYLKGVITYTNEGKSFISKYINKVNVYVCPAGIDTDIFKKNSIIPPKKIIHFIMVARMVEFKNYFDILDAISFVIQKNSNIKLTIVGRGKLEGSIHEYIYEKNLGPFIEIIPTILQEKLIDLYKKNDILVLPSFNEAIGMVVPEAMSLGLATITSDTVGANIYVKQNKTGLIFRTGDSRALSKLITKLLRNPSLIKNMKKEARDTIHNNYSLKSAALKLRSIIFTK